MRGVCAPASGLDAKVSTKLKGGVVTPHPSAFSAHLLPQGEKEELKNPGGLAVAGVFTFQAERAVQPRFAATV